MTFYRCSHCGNIITFMENKGVPVICCGEPMKELIPGSTDAAQEKHVPVILTEETRVRVSVGTAAHPMTAEHSIQWIALETEQGVSLRYLNPDQPPEAVFPLLPGEKVRAAYAYCNLHGLWMAL